MPNKLGVSAADICLYKSATLESIGFDHQQLERQYGQEISVLTPNRFFSMSSISSRVSKRSCTPG